MSYDSNLVIENAQHMTGNVIDFSIIYDKYKVIYANLSSLPISYPDRIVVDASEDLDVFHLYDTTMGCVCAIEVVDHDAAIDNDLCFLEGEDYITERTEYKLAQRHSMYKYLGTADCVQYYYREL